MSVIRFVPDPGRGEFINVGAVAGTEDDTDIDVRSVSNWRRAKQLDTRGVLGSVMDFVSSLQARADADEGEESRISRAVISQLSHEMCNVLQISAPIPVAVSTPVEAIDLAFEEMILDPESRRFRFLKKTTAQAITREAYDEYGITPLRNARVKAGPYDIACDFAVANGAALQIVRCWSFQLPDQKSLAEELKAWAWSIRALRHIKTAELAIEGRQAMLPVSSDVDVEAVFVPPADGSSSQVLDVAHDAFSDHDTRITGVSIDAAGRVAMRAAELLGLR